MAQNFGVMPDRVLGVEAVQKRARVLEAAVATPAEPTAGIPEQSPRPQSRGLQAQAAMQEALTSAGAQEEKGRVAPGREILGIADHGEDAFRRFQMPWPSTPGTNQGRSAHQWC